MSKRNSTLTAARLRELVIYDPLTGIFTWRVTRKGRGCVAGKVIGSDDGQGYLRIQIDGVRYKCQRLAWLYMTGEWPVYEVDHRDTNESNNIWTNLRDATRSVNQQNQRRAQRSNKASGLLGVKREKKRWFGCVTVLDKKHRTACFDTPQEAHEAYVALKRQLHAGCTL